MAEDVSEAEAEAEAALQAVINEVRATHPTLGDAPLTYDDCITLQDEIKGFVSEEPPRAVLALTGMNLRLDREGAEDASEDQWRLKCKGVFLGFMGDANLSQSQFPAAIANYTESVDIFEALGMLGKQQNALATLGEAYRQSSEVEKATECFSKALRLMQVTGDKFSMMTTFTGLGNMFASSKPQRAVTYYEQAMAVAKELGDVGARANALTGVGNVYWDLGQLQRSANCFEQSLALLVEVGDVRMQAKTLTNLGNVYGVKGETQRSISYFERSLKLRRQLLDKRGEANTLLNFGATLYEAGESERAVECFKESLEINKALGSKDRTATVLTNLGAIHREMGELTKAIEYYEQAVPLKQAIRDVLGEGIALDHLACAYQLDGRTEDAIEAYKESLDRFVMIWTSLANDRERASFLQTIQETSKKLEGIFVNEQCVEEALQTCSAARGRSLLMLLNQTAEQTEETGEDGVDLLFLARYASRTETAIVVYSMFPAEIVVYVINGTLNDDQSPQCIARAVPYDLVGATKAQKANETGVRDLGLVDPTAKAPHFEWIPQSRSVLPGAEDEVRIVDDESEAKDEVEAGAGAKEAGAKEGRAEGLEAKGTRANVAEVRGSPSPQSPTDTLRSSYESLIEAIEEDIQGAKRLMIVPDAAGGLSSTAFSALMDGSGRHLGEHFSIATIPSLGILQRMAQQEPASDSSGSSLVVGNPDFSGWRFEKPLPDSYENMSCVLLYVQDSLLWDMGVIVGDKDKDGLYLVQRVKRASETGTYVRVGESVRVSTEHLRPRPHRFPGGRVKIMVAGFDRFDAGASEQFAEGVMTGAIDPGGRCEIEMVDGERQFVEPSRLLMLSPHPLTPLIGAEDEAEEVADYLCVSDDNYLRGEEATLGAVVERMPNVSQVIHLATHGFVDDQVSGRSGVALCGASHDQAVLTAHRVQELRLQAQLVVLSACQSGLGTATAEGVLGIARSFLAAGVRAVVMTLWSVDDFATKELMTKLYELLCRQQTRRELLQLTGMADGEASPDEDVIAHADAWITANMKSQMETARTVAALITDLEMSSYKERDSGRALLRDGGDVVDVWAQVLRWWRTDFKKSRLPKLCELMDIDVSTPEGVLKDRYHEWREAKLRELEEAEGRLQALRMGDASPGAAADVEPDRVESPEPESEEPEPEQEEPEPEQEEAEPEPEEAEAPSAGWCCWSKPKSSQQSSRESTPRSTAKSIPEGTPKTATAPRERAIETVESVEAQQQELWNSVNRAEHEASLIWDPKHWAAFQVVAVPLM
mmetsp:Transcript_5577/g.21952  ORF Transcript_5577/g.21952 Transcript_5577/m.21952 type:complete len:1278 (-) Transcript_5577:354-4187(-)